MRKLEFLLAEALARGADTVVTLGGLQSNHCRATAVASRYVGLDSHLVLRTSVADVDKDPGLSGNLLVERAVGAAVELVSRSEYQEHGSVALGEMAAKRLYVAHRGLGFCMMRRVCLALVGSPASGVRGDELTDGRRSCDPVLCSLLWRTEAPPRDASHTSCLWAAQTRWGRGGTSWRRASSASRPPRRVSR